jgi:hypothetical protein
VSESSNTPERSTPQMGVDRLGGKGVRNPAFDPALGAPGQTPGLGAWIPVIPPHLRGAHIPTPPSLQADSKGLGCKGTAG